MNKKVGFFDSGIGGISVLTCAESHIPNCDFVYYADTDNVPYGTKTKSEIISFCDNAVSFLIKQNIDGIVIACNTATSMSIDYLREKYPIPIVGMEPALRTAFNKKTNSNILVCATPATISGFKLHHLIDLLGADPTLIPLPELVTLAENGIFEKDKVTEYLKKMISEPEKYDSVVLGCTHFTFFKDSFIDFFPNADIIDGNLGTVKRLASVLSLDFSESVIPFNGIHSFYKSGRVIDENDSILFTKLKERILSLGM